MRTAHAECAKRPSASPPRRRRRAHFAAMQTHGFAVENRPRIRRIPTAIQMARRRVMTHQSEPCRRCAAARSSAADALTYTTLVSHAKSGPRMRRSPRRAVPCSRRNGASLSPTDATKPTAWRRASAHPDHRIRGYDRVLLRTGDNRIATGCGLRRHAPTRGRANELEEPRIGSNDAGSLRGRGSGEAKTGLLIFSLIAGPWGEGAGPGLGTLKRPVGCDAPSTNGIQPRARTSRG